MGVSPCVLSHYFVLEIGRPQISARSVGLERAARSFSCTTSAESLLEHPRVVVPKILAVPGPNEYVPYGPLSGLRRGWGDKGNEGERHNHCPSRIRADSHTDLSLPLLDCAGDDAYRKRFSYQATGGPRAIPGRIGARMVTPKRAFLSRCPILAAVLASSQRAASCSALSRLWRGRGMARRARKGTSMVSGGREQLPGDRPNPNTTAGRTPRYRQRD